MLEAKLHRLMRFWMFQVPSRNLQEMPLFSLIDIPFIIAVSPQVWLQTLRGLRVMRRHLKTQEWSSLSALYPRTFMTAYAYMLQAWGRYCGCLDKVLQVPDSAIIAEVFLRYVCTIDDYIDRIDSRTLSEPEVWGLLHLPSARIVASELCSRIAALDLSLDQKMHILRSIVRYRRGVIEPLIAWYRTQDDSLEAVRSAKERMTGELWRTWSLLLGYVYCVPQHIAHGASRCFFDLGMMLQIIDDLGDTPVDNKYHAQNLWLSLACQVPHEYVRLNHYLSVQQEHFLKWAWVRENLPETYRKTIVLYQAYRRDLENDVCNPAVAVELGHMVERLRRLSG